MIHRVEKDNICNLIVQIMENLILLFDGVCNLCNSTVQFVLKSDKRGCFKFASLQSAYGQNFLEKNKLSQTQFDTFILIEGDSYSIKSTAILKVFRQLRGLWPALYLFIIIPKVIRDPFYNLVAKNRSRIFGKKDSCMVPDKDISSRFIE